MRRRGGRSENHVSFQRIAVVRRSRGEPAQSRMTQKRPSGAFIGLAYRSQSLPPCWKRGIIPPLRE
jgi:hypothetical protein